MKLGRPTYLLTAMVIVGILVFTLSPAGDTRMSFGLCLVCGERGLANIVGNLLLFLPLGVLLTLAGIRPFGVVLLAALLSTGIEIAQLWVPGRNPNPADTLFNTLGAAAGVALAGTSGWWLHARGARRWRLGAAALSAVLGTILGSGWLLGPTYPDATYYGQWTPEHEWLPGHPGRVLEARLGSRHIPSVRLEDGVGVRESLQAGDPLALHAVVGASSAETWPIFRIAAGRGTLVVTVARQWDDLLIRFHTRAAALRLTPPEVHSSGVFAGVPAADPVWIRVWRSGEGYCVEVDGCSSCGHGFTVGRAWALLHGAGPLPRPLWTLLDAGMLAALLLPVGFWWRRWPETLLGAALVTAALLLAPVFAVLRPTPPVEFAGAFFGLVAGAVLGRAGPDAAHGLRPERKPDYSSNEL
jgi:hypothetical protein